MILLNSRKPVSMYCDKINLVKIDDDVFFINKLVQKNNLFTLTYLGEERLTKAYIKDIFSQYESNENIDKQKIDVKLDSIFCNNVLYNKIELEDRRLSIAKSNLALMRNILEKQIDIFFNATGYRDTLALEREITLEKFFKNIEYMASGLYSLKI